MVKRIIHCPNKGSVLLVIICVIVALMTLLASFMKSTTNRVHSTKKIGDTMFARELANSLAILSNHYIKYVELKNSGSELIKVLSLPREAMGNTDASGDLKAGIQGKIKSGSEDIITTLLEAYKPILNEITLDELKWIVHKGDFASIEVGKAGNYPYPREKKGLIRIYIKISYKLPGQKKKISEDYLFTSPINVVANLVPVLSKFNFYVQNALGEEPNDDNIYRFNVIDTDAAGNLSNGAQVRPWIFANGGDAPEVAKSTYNEIMEDPRGVIFLGGGNGDNSIELGIACGWSDGENSDCGEDFHFFMNYPDKEQGYWKTLEYWDDKNGGVMVSEIGLCNAKSGDYLEWRKQLGAGAQEKSKYHSIFKLYGVDGSKKSPTLVLGYVNSLFASVKLHKFGNNEFEVLPHVDFEEDLPIYTAYTTDTSLYGSDAYGKLMRFSLHYCTIKGKSELEYEPYLKGYASKLGHRRYGKDYAYILTENKVDFPEIVDSKLSALCNLSSDDKSFLRLPYSEKVQYNKIYNVEKCELDKLFNADALSINAEKEDKRKRIAYCLKLLNNPPDDYSSTEFLISKGDEVENDIIDYLEFKGLINDNKLDINGWLYINNEAGFDEIPINFDSLKNISNGGIILSSGKLCLKSNIETEPNNSSHFSLIALNGDIVIEEKVTTVKGSLIAPNGQIRLIGGASSQKLTIDGNIVMSKICKGDVKGDNVGIKRGLTLNYNRNLAAIPYNDKVNGFGEERTESNLLMFDLKENVKMLD